MRPTITAAIIARDEAPMIEECLASVAWADERLVLLDTATRDRTRELAESLGARVEAQPFENFARQRDRALSLARSEWVLFVDADERVPPALRDEVLRAIAVGHVAGYWIPRHNVIMGRIVRGGGWYPDHQLRLLKRGRATFDPRRVVHEVALLDGPAGTLRAPLIHLNYRTFREFVRKQERYCRLDAERWLASYGRPRRRAVLGQPLREFHRRFVRMGGFREGPLGLALCLLLAYYAGRAVWLARREPSRYLA